ncbi:MAG: hypothetical protein E3J72_06510 [Planctomycetota bacterium]|nr:MAG: hypothetical protein E3J72_06510 [Planctomycetota bacterium]
MVDFSGNNNRIENNSGRFNDEHYLGVFINKFADYASVSSIFGDLDKCAKWLAVVIAHEIAHSLGIVDHDDTVPNIMQSSLPFETYEPAFTSAHMEFLIQIMPGPYRK